jgi:hypothetical protein
MAVLPVCGCNGKTYTNDCQRQLAGASKQSDGACSERDAGTGGRGGSGGTGGTGGSTGKTCGGFAGLLCAAGEFCETPAGSCNEPEGSGTCVVNTGTACPMYIMPVCGCNGRTYNNDCLRRAAGVSKQSDGACVTDAGQDVGLSADASSPAEQCTATGGQVTSTLCCSSATDFPNFCLVGACGCDPDYSHTISTCTCTTGCFLPGYGCVGPSGTCTVGADQSCNDKLTTSSIRGHCVADGRCVCGPGALLASGKCQ